ncbi:4-aminobutyrate--2-oxoglutarate transaminase [Aquitalea denitrificans]|uniref:4-aminobutyrate--2-oxoglutarate transaminase n=1 Tax=Aquitalea denitrificans TaxID=519081 RepID=UPI00135B777B|nr:4-aminobutyrate--2-oxoglutarate transaminase [Aquitalea denitrificans]
MSNKDLMQRKADATPRGVGVMCTFFADKAKNAEVWDVEGNRYIDFAGGIGVLNTGHLHAKVQAAVAEQLNRFSHTSYSIIPYESYVSVAEKLNQLTPGNFAKKTAFFSTGAEAVENAIKVARAATGRPGVIAFGGAFHGRTMLGMALTGKVAPYKIGFGPFVGEIYHAAYPNALHGVSVEDSLASIEKLFKFDIEAKRVAAIIFEPVQGEGGFNIAPTEWVVALRQLCDAHGIVLIADEVQAGFARTGKLFAMEHYPVAPDLTTMAKSLAGGFPLSALVGKAELMDVSAPGALGGTYAGSPLGLAAAGAVIDVIREENLLERSNKLGDLLKEKLHSLKRDIPQIADVRGLGAMVAVEFNQPGTQQPDAEFTKKVQSKALESGLILLTCGVYGNVLRFLFPLTIEDEIFAEALAKLEAALKA